jgi:hypothetical protein
MKLLIKILFLLFTVFTLSCSSNEKRVIQHKSKGIKVVPNQILVAEVEGMVCKMGCGGAIRKEMLQTKCVSRVEIDYQDGAEKQIIKVHFDDKLISESEIVKKLEKINKNQFKVYPIGTSQIESSSGSASNSVVNMSETEIELPNLIGILSSFIIE